jgi:dihydropteroate synthase
VNLTPLASRCSDVVRHALVRRGMDPSRAATAATGLDAVALLFDSLTTVELDSLVRAAYKQGVECISGGDWVLVAGSISGLAGLTRSAVDILCPEIMEGIGRYLRGLSEPPERWVTARGSIDLRRPVVVGILNVTPDSFSDGGLYLDSVAAVRHAESMLEAGARMLDIGAESTRPGRPQAVPATEEWRRLGPVLEELARRFSEVPMSVDTIKPQIAERALDAGAWAVNDVSGLRLNPGVADVCARHGAGLILMHSRGAFSELASYDHAHYEDVVADAMGELERSVNCATSRGVERERIVVDPGLGFSKRPEQNYEILHRLRTIAALGFPVMIGPSRKRFLGAVTGSDVTDRDVATAAACTAAYMEGADLFRVHSVGAVREALEVANAIRTV